MTLHLALGRFSFRPSGSPLSETRGKRSQIFLVMSLFIYFSVCVLVCFLSSSFRKKEQELDGQKKVTCLLLPIDFPVPFSGSLVSCNYSSAFSGSLGWDISHCGGLTVPRSPRGRLERWLSDNTSVGALESEIFIVSSGSALWWNLKCLLELWLGWVTLAKSITRLTLESLE